MPNQIINISSDSPIYRADTHRLPNNKLSIEFVEVEYSGSEYVDVVGGSVIMSGQIIGVQDHGGVCEFLDSARNLYKVSEANCVEFNDIDTSSSTEIYNAYMAAYTASIGTAPVFTVLPSITGNNYVGQVLSTTNGAWVGTAPITFTYEWKRDGQEAAIGTESTYTITSLDADQYITCTVTATNDFGSGSSVSNQVLVSINWGLGCAKNWGASTNAVWGV